MHDQRHMMIGKLTEEEIERVLETNSVGRIGCSDGGKTYVVPVSYVYDGHHVIAHSLYGLKIKMMRANPSVCFEVDEIRSNVNWNSVIAWGTYQELNDERDRLEAIRSFVNRMKRKKISTTAHPPGLRSGGNTVSPTESARAIIYRIILDTKTGRFERG